jgi:G3E family GTPase
MTIDIAGKLGHVRPSNLLSDPERGMPQLFINMITRACYSKAFKRLSGWKGTNRTNSSESAWTFSIKSRPGIYGVSHATTEKNKKSQTSEFMICYFPRNDEDVVDVMNLGAAMAVHQPNYDGAIRDFISQEPMIQPFFMGRMYMTLGHDENSLSFSLISPLKKQIICRDGIKAPSSPTGEYLISPGGYEENFPSFAMAMDLFSAICAAATFNLEMPPVCYERLEKPGEVISYDCEGQIAYAETPEAPVITLNLGYGNCSLWDHRATDKKILSHSAWHPGETYPESVAKMLWWEAHDLDNIEGNNNGAQVWDKRPQLVVLTGFLGAGKTSIVQSFVEYHTNKNNLVAVIQNEIGETGLDGKLLENSCNVVEMDEGCVCCTLAGRLSAGVKELMETFTPDMIILETTGLANPLNLLAEIEELNEIVRLDSITTVVDCKNALLNLDEFEIARDQIRAADIVIFNKTDLVPEEDLDCLEKRVEMLNPRALTVKTNFGDLNPDLLYNDSMDSATEPGHTPDSVVNPEAKGTAPCAHGNGEAHVCHIDEGISSIKISFNGPVNRSEFVAALDALPAGILRVKGLLQFSDTAEIEVCQYVGGRIDFSKHDSPYHDTAFVVVIGKHLNPEKLPGILSYNSSVCAA